MKLNSKEILEYLDNAIREWRSQRDSSNCSNEDYSMAVHYIDAFQSVRVSLFGERLL